MNCRVVSTLPTSTTNITGFFIIARGFSLTNESTIARLTISQFQTATFFVFLIIFGVRRLVAAFCCWLLNSQTECFDLGSIPSGDKSPHSISKLLSRVHQQMLDDRSQAERREKC